ncbi:SGNH/GDSL hydrolase family protein [Methylobacterium tardum]|uniref:SGNH/GDSL hydrolase family protein n=1 Tax=Methylobacterium tardum TaxID=374432 RepID=UPI00361963DF
MRRVVLLSLGGLALLAIGGFAGWRLHRPGADARAYAEMRLIAVQVSLDEAPPDYVFWAGDSQVELQPGSQRPCGLEFLNGGISGATAGSYAEYLARLTFKVHPRLAALTIGTNDILVKNNPQLHKPTEQFEAAAETIIKRLQALSPRVVVTALPRSDARSASSSRPARSATTRGGFRTYAGVSAASSPIRSRPCATVTPATPSPAPCATGCIWQRSGRR